jgi:hypothetical protein
MSKAGRGRDRAAATDIISEQADGPGWPLSAKGNCNRTLWQKGYATFKPTQPTQPNEQYIPQK